VAGGVYTTQTENVIPNTVRHTFAPDGTYFYYVDKSLTSTGVATTDTGTYTYTGNTITTTTNGKTSTMRVDVLTANNLTTVMTEVTSSNRYVTTDTYTR
jgi:hypothetical protein